MTKVQALTTPHKMFVQFSEEKLDKRSINYSFIKCELSVTQRQGISTCIPKENKPKQHFKNLLPITLLNYT